MFVIYSQDDTINIYGARDGNVCVHEFFFCGWLRKHAFVPSTSTSRTRRTDGRQ